MSGNFPGLPEVLCFADSVLDRLAAYRDKYLTKPETQARVLLDDTRLVIRYLREHATILYEQNRRLRSQIETLRDALKREGLL